MQKNENQTQVKPSLIDFLQTLPARVKCQIQVTNLMIQETLPNVSPKVHKDLVSHQIMLKKLEVTLDNATAALLSKPTVIAEIKPKDPAVEAEEVQVEQEAQETQTTATQYEEDIDTLIKMVDRLVFRNK
nr:MAG: protein B [Xinjiang mountain noda-like virus 2]